MSKIFLSTHMNQAGQLLEDKEYWLEHARGTKRYAKFGLLAGQALATEIWMLWNGKLGKTHSIYIIVYCINLLWQAFIFILMPVCY